jgi:transposase
MLNNRKSRKTINTETIKTAMRLISEGKDTKSISYYLSLSKPATLNLIKKIQDNPELAEKDCAQLLKKLGRKSNTINEMQSSISTVISKTPDVTQQGILKLLEIENINVSQSTISRNLKSMGYSRKRLVKIPEERNSLRNIDLRQNFCRFINNYQDRQLIFLDECGFSLHTSRYYGYAPKNEKAYITVKGNRGKNVSLLCMIGLEGVLGYKVVTGSINSHILVEFMKDKIINNERFTGNNVLIMDNVKFHHSSVVKNICNVNNITIKHMPPYSPQLNPIEEFFSSLKSRYSSIIPKPKDGKSIINNINALIHDIQNQNNSGIYRNLRTWIEKGLSRHPFI